MKSKVLLFVFIITGLIVSCQNATKLPNESFKSTLKGTWEVEKVETIGDYNDYLELDSDSSFYFFFSSEDWGNAQGEFFYFHEDSTLSTSLFPEGAEEFVELRYFMEDNKLKIDCLKLQGDRSELQLYLDINSLTQSQMVWMFGNYMKISFKKVFQ